MADFEWTRILPEAEKLHGPLFLASANVTTIEQDRPDDTNKSVGTGRRETRAIKITTDEHGVDMTGKGWVQGLLLLLADEMEARCVGVSGGAGFWVDGTCFVYSRDQDDSTNNNQITRQSIGEKASNISI